MNPFPVRRVHLYKHGVGYFEREAVVSGTDKLSLTFPERDISDVLKSLTVVDQNGGLVTAIGYEAAPPADRLLADISLTVPDANSLTGLLPQLKGAQVVVTPTAEPGVAGVLLGLDSRTVSTPTGGEREQVRVSVLTSEGEVHAFPLDEVSIAFLDASVRRDLDAHLRVSLASRTTNARTFTLHAAGTGERTIQVGYLRETPVWKATYRLLLSAGEERPFLQGWAIVDNTTDDDWSEITLTLVAGLPVSFRHDLYSPRYVSRPEIKVAETAGVRPPKVQPGYDAEQHAETARMYSMPKMAMAAAPAPARARSAKSTVAHTVTERDLGELFQYAVSEPVSVGRGQSALVPIVQTPFDGQAVLLYQQAAQPNHPMRCVEMRNSTPLTLEGGPATVLFESEYVGEAMLDTLKPGEERLVPYAVDLGVRVFCEFQRRDEPVSSLHIKNGVIHLTKARVDTTKYIITVNAGSQRKPETLYLDHPRRTDMRLTAPADGPHQITPDFWRFKLQLPASGQLEFCVEASTPILEQVSVTSQTNSELAVWLSGKLLSQDAARQLQDVFTARDRLAQLDAAQKIRDTDRAQRHAEQERIRDNLTALGERPSEQKLRERLVKSLSKHEDHLAALDEQDRAAVAERTQVEADLQAKLAAVHI